MKEKLLQLEVLKKNKQIQDLYVLIDTLQTNLRSTTSYLNDEQKREINTRSYKWCMKWTAGDETK
jgi:hypothetical protein